MKKSLTLLFFLTMVSAAFAQLSDGTFLLYDNGDLVQRNGVQLGAVVKIPKKVGVTPVKTIRANAFANNDAIVHLTIEDGIETIGYGAFQGCLRLRELVIGEGVKRIEGAAFEGCVELEKVTLPESLQQIGNEAFKNCIALGEVAIKKNVEQIGSYAFAQCNELSKLTLDNGIRRIEKYAFENTNLKAIDIPASVEWVDGTVFAFCRELEKVSVASENADFYAKSDVLYTKRTGELLLYPAARAETAFSAPKDIRGIHDFAFSACKNLVSVSLPKSVQQIGVSAFDSCEKLRHLNFGGTKADWQKMLRSNEWLHETKLTVHCQDGDVAR